jgi:hypothetical protein
MRFIVVVDNGHILRLHRIKSRKEGGTPAERAALIAKVESIKTRGEARAYMQSVIPRAKAAKARNRRR